jgi:hypothetical protein
MSLEWVVSDSATMGGQFNERLIGASSRTLTEDLNSPGSASFRLPLDDAIGMELDVLRYCLKVLRNGRIVWSGPLWLIQEGTDENMGYATYGAKGWFEILFHRRIWPDQVPLILTLKESWQHIEALLAAANSKGSALPGSPTPTFISAGLRGVTGTGFTKSYEAYQNIGDAIRQMTQVENGVDVRVDAGTRKLDVYELLGSVREEAIFRLKGENSNLTSASRSIDASNMANGLWVVGANGSVAGRTDDLTSQMIYPLMEEQLALNSVSDENILAAYANAELVARRYPTVIHDISPLGYVGKRTPLAYVDFDLGDTVKFSARRGRMNIQEQYGRVFGFTIQDGDDGIERITSLKMEAS